MKPDQIMELSPQGSSLHLVKGTVAQPYRPFVSE